MMLEGKSWYAMEEKFDAMCSIDKFNVREGGSFVLFGPSFPVVKVTTPIAPSWLAPRPFFELPSTTTAIMTHKTS